jgi:ATP-dependent DNA helicase RecG
MQEKTRRGIRTNDEVRYLRGVGPKRADVLARADMRTVEDLLRFFPRRYLDRRQMTTVSELVIGEQATVLVRVVGHKMSHPRRGRQRFIVRASDDTGACELVWFAAFSGMGTLFEPGTSLAVSGVPRKYGRFYQFAHPDVERLGEDDDAELLHGGRIVPLYPVTDEMRKAGVGQKTMRKLIAAAIEDVGVRFPDPIPETARESLALHSLPHALALIHFPEEEDDAERARSAFAFEELLGMQLALARMRSTRRKETATPVPRAETQLQRFLRSLPFTLTEGQQRALDEILDDMSLSVPMARLLMGDVGSGKTVVATAAVVATAHSGGQSAFMAPTEVLAHQHARNLRNLLDPVGLSVALVVGGDNAERRRTLARIRRGEVNVTVGTHALIESGVAFSDLRFVVVDEQHRFGVRQRLKLAAKGASPHVLVMTATPIPRTLALTVHGDLDASAIHGLPPGRQPVATAVRGESERGRVEEFLREEVGRGGRVYIVFPLVEESEKLDLKDAVRGHERLSCEVFPDVDVGLVHGRMPGEEKRAALDAFASGRTPVLVSTTVIEVGVDVPEATVLVVEHAERFGLAQLHQLRGRVGRGENRSYCILMSQSAIDYPNSTAAARLKVLVETSDGFEIAEQDLRLRGPGELLGTRQHGLLELCVADLVRDARLVPHARDAARDVLNSDPKLERHPLLRALLERTDRLRAQAARAG